MTLESSTQESPSRSCPVEVTGSLLNSRKRLALAVAVYSFLIYPNLLVYLILKHGLPTDALSPLLIYMAALASGPIGMYLWAAARRDTVIAKSLEGQ